MCVLCNAWKATSYPKRPTTPVSGHEVEGAITLGFWVALKTPELVLCARHVQAIDALDRQKEANEERERQRIAETARRAEEERQKLERAREFTVRANAARALLVSKTVEKEEGGVTLVTTEEGPLPPKTGVPRFPCPFCATLVASGEVHPCNPSD